MTGLLLPDPKPDRRDGLLRYVSSFLKKFYKAGGGIPGQFFKHRERLSHGFSHYMCFCQGQCLRIIG